MADVNIRVTKTVAVIHFNCVREECSVVYKFSVARPALPFHPPPLGPNCDRIIAVLLVCFAMVSNLST